MDGKIWNGKIYNYNGESEFEIKNGAGNIKEYYDNNKLAFEGEYLNGNRWNGKLYNYQGDQTFIILNGNESRKSIIIKVNWILMENV